MKLFGIKAIIINGTTVHTYNVRITNNEQNQMLVKTSELPCENITTRHGERIQLTFTTTSIREFNDKVNILGHLLRAVALNNLNKKYSWVK
jgi:hypothetical protein